MIARSGCSGDDPSLRGSFSDSVWVTMKTLAIEGDLHKNVVAALAQSPLFRGLGVEPITQVVACATLHQFDAGEAIVNYGEPSDALYLLLRGDASVWIPREGSDAGLPDVPAGASPPDAFVEVGRMRPPDAIGEIGLLLSQPRTATVRAEELLLAIRLEAQVFAGLLQRVPSAGLAMSRALAARLWSRTIPLSDRKGDEGPDDPEVLGLLPIELCERFRMLALRSDGKRLTVGFVDDPSPRAVAAIRQSAPGLELHLVRIDRAHFDQAVRAPRGLRKPRASPQVTAQATGARGASKLDELLRRMVEAGASDLHLCAGQKPRWRVDGELREVPDGVPLGAAEPLELLGGALDARGRAELENDGNTEFSYALAGSARFRTTLYRDQVGVGAALRQVPEKVPSLEQLGLPAVLRSFCELPSGLVLATGLAGSGRSTTLAALIDGINQTRPVHVITLEDPVEFVHTSNAALVHHRAVGPHAGGFARALRAALREDPDVVLVGELRDRDAAALVLETAHTGRLVFAALHAATAASAIDQLGSLFAADQQAQVRSTLSEVLRGVLWQTLCRKIGGGRIAALELLAGNSAVSTPAKDVKAPTPAAVKGKAKVPANLLLNDELARLVAERKVEFDEAMSKSSDKADLAKKCGRDTPAAPPSAQTAPRRH